MQTVESLFLDAPHLDGIWSILGVDVVSGEMSSEDLELAESIASKISMFNESHEKLMRKFDLVCASFEQEVEEAVERYENKSSKPPRNNHLAPLASTRYIKTAYNWLLQNLAKPYPSKPLIDQLARDSDCESRLIEGWFMDIRRRMGWNDICKRHFSNKRSLIIAAATDFFNGTHSGLLNDTIRLAFSKMSMQAEDLYNDKFVESKLAINLGGQIDDVSAKGSKRQKRHDIHASLPTPEQSPQERQVKLPEFSNKRKRHRTSDSTNDKLCARKRIRHNVMFRSHPTLPGLSPVPSEQVQTTSSGIPCNRQQSKRKRRLSDTDAQLPKHPSSHSRTARLQTVSGPLPIGKSLLSSAGMPTAHHFDISTTPPLSDNAIDLFSTPSTRTPSLSDDTVGLFPTPSTPTHLHVASYKPYESLFFDGPEVDNCTLPVSEEQPVHLSLYTPGNGYGCQLPVDDTTEFNLNSGRESGESLQALLNTDIGQAWSKMFEMTNDTLLNFTTPPPSVQLMHGSDVDDTFINFLNIDSAQNTNESQRPTLFPMDILFPDNNNPTFLPIPTAAIDDEIIRGAEIEALKKQHEEIAERIRFLETGNKFTATAT